MEKYIDTRLLRKNKEVCRYIDIPIHIHMLVTLTKTKVKTYFGLLWLRTDHILMTVINHPHSHIIQNTTTTSTSTFIHIHRNMEPDLCSTLIAFPESIPCTGNTQYSFNSSSSGNALQEVNHGMCTVVNVVFGESDERKEPRCDCFTSLWQGIGDFTPSYAIHCDLHSSAIQALWWMCMYFQASVLIYCIFIMYKYCIEKLVVRRARENSQPKTLSPVPETLETVGDNNRRGYGLSFLGNKKNESQRSRTESALSFLRAESYPDGNNKALSPYHEKLSDNIHVARTDSRFEVVTTLPGSNIGTNVVIHHVDEPSRRPEWKRVWSIMLFCLLAVASSSFGISLCSLKLYNPIRFGIGRDLTTTLLFSLSNAFFWCGFSAYFHNRTMIAHAMSRKPRSQLEWNAVSRGRFLNFILFPCIAIVSVFVSLLPLILTFDLGELRKTYKDIIDSINIVLIILILTYELIVFMAMFGHALAVSPLKTAKNPYAKNVTILKTFSKRKHTVNPPIYRFPSLDEDAVVEETTLDRPKSPLHSRKLTSQSPPLRVTSDGHKNAVIERTNSRYSTFSPVQSVSSVWTASFLSPQTVEMARFSLVSLLLGLPLLGLVAWPYIARRVSYLIPILISGQCISWVYILYDGWNSRKHKASLPPHSSVNHPSEASEPKKRKLTSDSNIFDDLKEVRESSSNESQMKLENDQVHELDNSRKSTHYDSRSLTVASASTHQSNSTMSRTSVMTIPYPPASPVMRSQNASQSSRPSRVSRRGSMKSLIGSVPNNMNNSNHIDQSSTNINATFNNANTNNSASDTTPTVDVSINSNNYGGDDKMVQSGNVPHFLESIKMLRKDSDDEEKQDM